MNTNHELYNGPLGETDLSVCVRTLGAHGYRWDAYVPGSHGVASGVAPTVAEAMADAAAAVAS